MDLTETALATIDCIRPEQASHHDYLDEVEEAIERQKVLEAYASKND